MEGEAPAEPQATDFPPPPARQEPRPPFVLRIVKCLIARRKQYRFGGRQDSSPAGASPKVLPRPPSTQSTRDAYFFPSSSGFPGSCGFDSQRTVSPSLLAVNTMAPSLGEKATLVTGRS